jgi:hypothetical protein
MADAEDLDSIADHTHDKKNPLLVPVRIVLFALLAVAIIGLIFDQMARRKAQAAFDKVYRAMGDKADVETVTRGQVYELIGRQPDEDSNPDDDFETFSWPGALRPQVIFVEYRPGTDLVQDASLNEKPLRSP